MPKIIEELEPFWTTADGEHVKLYLGNVVDVLRGMPEKSVQMSVTSPPYWGLRSYTPDTVQLRTDLPRDVREAVIKELTDLGVDPIGV